MGGRILVPMRPVRLAAPALLALLPLRAQAPLKVEAKEIRLQNGARVLVVERPGTGAFQATLCFRGGASEEPPGLHGANALLARALYGATLPVDLEEATRAQEELAAQEDTLREALRLERKRLERGSGSEARATELEVDLKGLRARRRNGTTPSLLTDLYRSVGGNTQARVGQDALTFSAQLPGDQLEAFLRTETRRLQTLRLARLPEAREELVAHLRSPSRDRGPGLLASAALPGHPYGQDPLGTPSTLESIRTSDLRAFARARLVPDRMLLVLVGEVGSAPLTPLLERTLGTLRAQEAPEPALADLDEEVGERRFQVQSGDRDRLLLAWRVPPRNHPDYLPLRALLGCLVEGPSSRLAQRLVDRGLARSVSGSLGAEGARQLALLQVEVQPADGVGLATLEGAVAAEVLRLQQEPPPLREWQRRVQQADLEAALLLQSPAGLAQGLALAWAETGDWRPLLSLPERLARLGPEAVQAVARKYLVNGQRTVAYLSAELTAFDPVETAAAEVLGALARRRLEDPAQVEAVVSEGLRQLRMLPREDRERTVRLLQDQVKPR